MLNNDEWLGAMIKACVRYLLIVILWQFLEVHFYGGIQPRIVDDIIGIFLFYYIAKREEEKALAKRVRNKAQQKNNLAQATLVMRNLPVPALLQSIEWQLDVLREKGIEVKDWDDKGRTLQQVRWIGGKAYFFAETKNDSNDTAD